MKKIHADFKKGVVKVRIENADDLWYLSQVIEAGDLVSGKTLRKVKHGDEEGKQKASKKPVFIKIKVEKIEYTENELRTLGIIEEGPEDAPKGEHHSFSLEEGSEISIEKEWLNFQRKKLEEAFSSKISPILIVVFDREEAFFAKMKKYGYELLANIQGNVAKKDMDEGKKPNFYLEILQKVKEYDDRLHPDHIIMGSPAFWKEELLKNLNDEALKKKMVLATCSAVGKTAINEVLKRDEVKKVLHQDRITKEINIIEELMKEISNQGKAAYGLKEVEQAAQASAVETLLITDGFIQKARNENTFSQIDAIMRTADKNKASVNIISSKHDGGKKLDGLGGIGAILRYKLNY
ncbi:mRNA surveillance protein pelota [Candidatus Woesearchaeota archaeon]|nr:mRNA surveillance protein pelota [Candidatus Woesearchaeota archaeon]